MIRTGTCNFKTFEAAVDYYATMGFERREVAFKQAQGDFEVGKPKLLRGQRAKLDKDKRYHIEDDLNEEQRQAMESFMERHGRYWKKKLACCWFDNSDTHEPFGHCLRQIRNQFGYQWLYKF